MLTQAKLKSILHYNSETGIFTWLVSSARNVKIGDIAGTLHKFGYIVIESNYKQYKAHRLAWLYVTGNFPIDKIDHINGVKNDNRINNLRECNQSENNQNSKTPVTNTSGFRGVDLSKSPHVKPYRARISVDNKKVHLGYFNTALEASNAYKEAKKKYHTFNPIIRD